MSAIGITKDREFSAIHRIEYGIHRWTWATTLVVSIVLFACGQRPPDGDALVGLSMQYLTESDGDAVKDELVVAPNAADIEADGELRSSQGGIRKAIALTNMVKGLQAALTLYHEEDDVEAAVAMAAEVESMLEAEVTRAGSESLQIEIELVEGLVENMEAGGSEPIDYFEGDAFYGDAAGGGGLGATPGGAQDIGYLRRLVESGYVPLAEHLAAEGLFSEHDLPLEGPACSHTLCLRAAYGWGPDIVTGIPTTYVQLGFSSGIDAATFQRKPLNLSVVIDVSGSMRGDRIEAAREALARLIGNLGPEDRLSLVTFSNTVSVLQAPVMVNDPAALVDKVESLVAGGGTDIEAGLEQGYEFVGQFAGDPNYEDRVLLITDAQPNIGATGESEFVQMAEDGAELGIGLTTLGVGIEFGYELVLAISRVRGANFVYLEDAEKLRRVFDDDFDFLVTPLAYDLNVEIIPGAQYDIRNVYGIPTWSAGDGTAAIDVATIFLSRNRGAILIELDGATPVLGPQISSHSVSAIGSPCSPQG